MRFFFLEGTSCCFIHSIISLALNSDILLCSGRFIFMFIEKSYLLLPSILCTRCLYDLFSFRSCSICSHIHKTKICNKIHLQNVKHLGVLYCITILIKSSIIILSYYSTFSSCSLYPICNYFNSIQYLSKFTLSLSQKTVFS